MQRAEHWGGRRARPQGVATGFDTNVGLALPPAPLRVAEQSRAALDQASRRVRELEGQASSLQAQLAEAQKQLAAWQGKVRQRLPAVRTGLGCSRMLFGGFPAARVPGGTGPLACMLTCRDGACGPGLERASAPPALRPPLQESELATAQRMAQEMVQRMFASPAWAASPRQNEIHDVMRALEGQAAEVRGPGCGHCAGRADGVSFLTEAQAGRIRGRPARLDSQGVQLQAGGVGGWVVC